MGNIVDIVDHLHPQEDIIYFSEKDYTNGAIGIFRNTKFVSQLFKAVPRDLSDHVFYETKSHVAGFEEGIFPCQMMKQESVTARLFPNTVCDKVQAWWWYKGNFFHLGNVSYCTAWKIACLCKLVQQVPNCCVIRWEVFIRPIFWRCKKSIS
jgi:hypothetical protein